MVCEGLCHVTGDVSHYLHHSDSAVRGERALENLDLLFKKSHLFVSSKSSSNLKRVLLLELFSVVDYYIFFGPVSIYSTCRVNLRSTQNKLQYPW